MDAAILNKKEVKKNMEKTKKTIVKHLQIDESKRLIFLSDIHGDIRLFKKALEEVHFSDSDELFVIGDMIEKGDAFDNLMMLNEIIRLNSQSNVHFMAGNCDEIFRFIMPPLDKKRFLYYALVRQKSIINDLAFQLNFPLNEDMDIDAFVRQIEEAYPEYYDFIDHLPDVIFLNDKVVLVHGGLLDINHIPEEAIEVLKFDRFLELSKPQPLPMIVGHNPTRNYHTDITSVDPIFDSRKNIISIDGGNNVIKGGQLNVVIMDNLAHMNFSFIRFDHYPKYIMKEDVNYAVPAKKFNIQFGRNEVELLAKDLDFYLIRVIGSTDELWVHEDFIYRQGAKAYCFDGSNTFLNLKKGDLISVIKKAMPYSLVKHEGIVGLIETKYIHEDFVSNC